MTKYKIGLVTWNTPHLVIVIFSNIKKHCVDKANSFFFKKALKPWSHCVSIKWALSPQTQLSFSKLETSQISSNKMFVFLLFAWVYLVTHRATLLF